MIMLLVLWLRILVTEVDVDSTEYQNRFHAFCTDSVRTLFYEFAIHPVILHDLLFYTGKLI